MNEAAIMNGIILLFSKMKLYAAPLVFRLFEYCLRLNIYTRKHALNVLICHIKLKIH